MNSDNFSTFHTELVNVSNKRDNLMDSSAHMEGINENCPEASTFGHEDVLMGDSTSDGHQSKRTRVDEPSPVQHALPGLQLRVRAPSDFNNRPEIVNGSGSFSARKLKKHNVLNIVIPPPLSASKLGSPSAGPPEAEEGSVTPVMQMIHTPTMAPGAPGPGDPAEQRRLERCWAAAASNGHTNQLSPVFAPIGPGPSAMEMHRITAEATTPTFPPESFMLNFGSGR